MLVVLIIVGLVASSLFEAMTRLNDVRGRLSPFLRKIRMRTSQSIVQEMIHLHRTYGVTGFMLYDDELNVNPKFVELMELIRFIRDRFSVANGMLTSQFKPRRQRILKAYLTQASGKAAGDGI